MREKQASTPVGAGAVTKPRSWLRNVTLRPGSPEARTSTPAAILDAVTVEELTQRLMAGGFVAADEEAEELMATAAGDEERLEAMVRRREDGEPLAWITGSVEFCGLTIAVHKDVYVPRWHTELVAERAAELLPEDGVAIDLCTGCGAVAAVLKVRRPHARVIGTDLDPNAVANAKANGVEAYQGNLFGPLPPGLRADVVVGVVPFVPRRALPLLQRDPLRL